MPESKPKKWLACKAEQKVDSEESSENEDSDSENQGECIDLDKCYRNYFEESLGISIKDYKFYWDYMSEDFKKNFANAHASAIKRIILECDLNVQFSMS